MSNAASSVSRTSRHATSWFLLILANVVWASSYVAAKFILHDISAVMMNALRMSFAALVLLPLLIRGRRKLYLTRKDVLQLALLALMGFVINKMLEYGGLALTTASDVALLITSETIFTAALSWLLLRERFKLMTIGALLLGFVGVYLIIERSLIPNIPSGGGAFRVIGDLLVVLGLVFEAFYTVRGKSLLVKHSPLLITAAAIIGSAVFWVPVAGWNVLVFGWHPLSLVGWLALGWMVLVVTVVGYLAWFQGLARVKGSAAASALFVQPLLGTLLAVVLLHEQLTLFTVVGGVFIIVSVLLVSRQ